MVFFVYLLLFSNGKIYVGMSRVDKKGLYTTRYRGHARDARVGKRLPVYDAWREFGPPEQIILSEHPTREECAEAEIEMIYLLGATNRSKGYNIQEGGQGLHAPKGTPIHEHMRKKVWENPERNARLSAALKGRKPSEETSRAYRDWLENGGREIHAATAKAQYEKPGAREAAAARTRQQMTEEARAHLSRKHKGRSDPRSEAGKASQAAKLRAYLDTPEGRANCRKGHEVSSRNPDNVAKRDANLATWRSSEENLRNCRRIAALSAKACRRPVKDLKTGIEYPSQRDMAKALGISDGAVSLRIKKGTAKRI